MARQTIGHTDLLYWVLGIDRKKTNMCIIFAHYWSSHHRSI